LTEVKGPLKSKYQAYDKELDEIFDVLASAELMIDEAKMRGIIDFKFDYSGIIILYCKAIEILEQNKCEKLKEIIEKIIDESYELQKVTDKHYKNKQKVVNVYIKENKYFNDMVNEIKRVPYEDGTPNPIFKYSKAGKKLTAFMNFGVSGDMYMYNTLLFIYYVETKKIDNPKFEFFKKVYELYIDERNGSAHTHTKSSEDADKVRIIVMGDENSKHESMVYKLVHSLN
jgi:hypothetical protein